MKAACKEYITFFKNGKVSDVNPDCVIENPFFVSDAKEGENLNIDTTENISDAPKSDPQMNPPSSP